MSKDFKKIARKIKRRRIIVSAIIILVTLMATTSVLNYKASQGNEEPFISLLDSIISNTNLDMERTTVNVFRSGSLMIRILFPFLQSNMRKFEAILKTAFTVERVLPATSLMFSVLMKRKSLMLLRPEIKRKSIC